MNPNPTFGEPSPNPMHDSNVEGLRLASAGNFAEAVGQFEKAARLEPENPIRHFNLALAYQHLDRLPDAIAPQILSS